MNKNIITSIMVAVFGFILGIVFIILRGYNHVEAMVLAILFYISVIQTINFLDLKYKK